MDETPGGPPGLLPEGEGAPRLAGDDPLIMMIDDEPIVMEVLQLWLQGQGFSRFVLCDEPREALAMIEAQRPAVVLLDLVMPDVTGYEILRALRSQPGMSELPVIVLTSSSDAAMKERALELGATDFLAKPVDPGELSLRLRKVLSAR